MDLEKSFHRFAAGSVPGPMRPLGDNVPVPCRLAADARVIRNVRRGRPLRGDEIDLHANQTLLQLRRAQDACFFA